MATSTNRDLSALSQLLASSRFDPAECYARLVALERAEPACPRPRPDHRALIALRDPVRAIGAARRAEGRTAATMRDVLGALSERDVGHPGVVKSQLFHALFGGSGRNTYFDFGPTVPNSLVADERWHELVVALETGDVEAKQVVLQHMSPHERIPHVTQPASRAYVLHEWDLTKRHAKIDGAPLARQVRWILDTLTLTLNRRRRAARGLALELGIDVPEDDNNEYSVAAAVSLVAQLPEDFPEWDELFELTILELKEAHIGTTIGEALATVPWDAIADERKDDTITIRRSFRGHEVKWTSKLWRLGRGSGDVYDDFKGRLSSKRLARPLAPGVRWATLLDQDERFRFGLLAAKLGDVFALPDLLAAGVTLPVGLGLRPPQLRAMAPYLSRVLAAERLDRLGEQGGRSVVALLDRVMPTEAQLLRFAAYGMTDVFDVLYDRLSPSTRQACLSAAEAAHQEGTADVLRKGPPSQPVIPKIEVPLLAPPARSPAKKKPKRPKPIELPVQADLEPVAIAISNDRIYVTASPGDLAFERTGDVWTQVATGLRSAGLRSGRIARGDGFTLIESFETHGKSWRMWVDGQEPAPLRGPGASHPSWSERAIWTAAGGSLVVVGTFRHGALALPVSKGGELQSPATLARDKVSGVLTDGKTVLVRRPASVEAYDRDAHGWRRTHESTFSPAGWAVSGDRFALGNPCAETKHGRGTVHIYRRRGEGWVLEREVIAPKPKVEGFGTHVGLAGNTLVVSSGDKQGLRWVFSDLSGDEPHALPVAGKSRWALNPAILVDAHRGKKRDAPLALTIHPLT